jgi:O-antigen ligase
MRYARLRKFIFWGFSGILFFMLISGNGLAIYKSVSTRIISSFDSLFSTQQVDEDLGYLVRVSNWAAAAAIIAESPVLGVGLGGYAMEAKKIMSADELLSKSGLFSDKPYNLYLDILVSLGLLGFLLFLLFIFVTLYHCFRESIKNKDPFISNISFAGGIIVIIMLTKGITGEVFFESGQLWIFLAIVMSASSLPKGKGET